jgi:molecular chaperone GrpE
MDNQASETDERLAADRDIEDVRRALETEQDRHLRLRAEFDNFRRRSTRDQEVARDAGRRATLLPLLAVLDTLERALEAGSTDEAFYDGVAATERLFVNTLRNAGVEPIETVGQAFDPTFHDAVVTVMSDDVEPGTVVREVRRGWRLGNELLRPAQVVVAAPRESTDSWR